MLTSRNMRCYIEKPPLCDGDPIAAPSSLQDEG
jgi:hypothetical protein